MAHTFTASAAYGYGGKQWIARITGRVSGAATFEREFVGVRRGKRDESTVAIVDEPGLYETCDIDRKGEKDYSYAYYDGERCTRWCTRERAMDLAKHLDQIEIWTDEDGDLMPRVKAAPESPVDAALAACRAALANLSDSQRSTVIASLLGVSASPDSELRYRDHMEAQNERVCRNEG